MTAPPSIVDEEQFRVLRVIVEPELGADFGELRPFFRVEIQRDDTAGRQVVETDGRQQSIGEVCYAGVMADEQQIGEIVFLATD